MIINANNLRSAFIGFSTAYQGGLGLAPSTYGRVAMEVPSTTRGNEYGWLGQMPRVREWVGDRVIQGLEEFGYYIRNRDFELTIGVDKNDFDDDNLGIFAPLFTNMGRAAAVFPDELTWPLLTAGIVTPCYDGQYFFDTDHPVRDAAGNVTSVSNFGGGTGAAWYLIDQGTGFKPLIFQKRRTFEFVRMDAATDEVVFDRKQYRYGIDGRCNVGFGFWQVAYCSKQPLTSDNYAAARAAMSGMRGDYGRPLGLLGGAKPLLVVPTTLEAQAKTLLMAERDQAGATNIWRDSAEMLMTAWLG